MDSPNKLNSLKQIRNTVHDLNLDPYLHFIYSEDDLALALNGSDNFKNLEILLKKGLVYANKTIVITNEIVSNGGAYGPGYGSGVSGGPYEFPNNLFKTSKLENSIHDLITKYKSNHNFLEKFYFIPSRIRANVTYIDPYDFVQERKLTEFEFSETYSNNLGLNVSLRNPNVKNHVLESSRFGVMNIWLPQLKNVPLELMLKLMEDEEDTFKVYQYELKRLLAEFDLNDSEKKLIELFQTVDENIRKLKIKLENIKKTATFSKIDAFIGSTVIGLTFALPEEISNMLISILGSYKLLQLKDHLFKHKEKINDLKSSEFYIPWLINEKG